MTPPGNRDERGEAGERDGNRDARAGTARTTYVRGHSTTTPRPVTAAIAITAAFAALAFATAVLMLLTGVRQDQVGGLLRIFGGHFGVGGVVLLAHAGFDGFLAWRLARGEAWARLVVLVLAAGWGTAWILTELLTRDVSVLAVTAVGGCVALLVLLTRPSDTRAYFAPPP